MDKNNMEPIETNNIEAAQAEVVTDAESAALSQRNEPTQMAVPKTSSSIYEMDFGDELYASPEEIKELAKEGELDQLAYLQKEYESDGSYREPNWKFHRRLKFGKSELIEWTIPLSKAEKNAGKRANELNTLNPKHQILGLRGIPIKFEYGLGAKDEAGRFACQTIKLIEHLDEDRETVGLQPLKKYVERVYYSKDKPNKPSFFFENHPHLDLYAQRRYKNEPTINENGEKEDPKFPYRWETRRCLDCIAKQEYTYKEDEDSKEALSCRPVGSLLYAVFEVGIKDSTKHLESDVDHPVDIRWISVKDLEVKDLQGDEGPLNRPFIVRLEGLGSSQLSKIGTGEWDLPVKLPSHFKPNEPKTYFLPDDNVMSTKEFYDFLHERRGVGRVDFSVSGSALYSVFTELYIAELSTQKGNKDFAPVFRPVVIGKETEYNGRKIRDYVREAYSVMKFEAELSQGSAGTYTSPELNSIPEHNLPAATSQANSRVSKNPASAPAVQQSAVNTYNSRALNAYTPPTKK